MTTGEYFDQCHLRVFGYLPRYDRQLIFSSLYYDNIIVLQNSIAVILLSGSRMKNTRVFRVQRGRYIKYHQRNGSGCRSQRRAVISVAHNSSGTMASVYRRYYYRRNVLPVLINHYHNSVIYTYVFPRGFFSLFYRKRKGNRFFAKKSFVHPS